MRLPDLKAGLASAAISAVTDALGGGFMFELPINPEQYSQNFKNTYYCPKEQGPSSQSSDTQFARTEGNYLDIKFTIDGTGVVPIQQPGVDLVTQAFAAVGLETQLAFVTAKLKQLREVTFGIVDETHRPPFIMVNWGKLTFTGILHDMTQNFTLFHSSGLPLRVEVTLKIQEYKAKSGLLAALSLLSPDLTRKRQVKSSDNVLTLCEEVYDKPDYYIEVAKANNLSNFRKLKAGDTLLFPPVAK